MNKVFLSPISLQLSTQMVRMDKPMKNQIKRIINC